MIFLKTINGVNLATATSSLFKTNLQTALAATLFVPVSDVTINSIIHRDTRRQLLGDAIDVSYTVTAANIATSTVMTAVTASASSLTLALNNLGYTSATAMSAAAVDRSPTSAPVSPYSNPQYGVPSCFAGTETVSLESGETKAISEVAAGDRLLAATTAGKIVFSEVVFVPHGANKEKALFVHVSTEAGHDIKMTQNHVLPAGKCGTIFPLIYAAEISVNDCILTVSGEERVVSVQSVRGEGVYTIVTYEEFIVVNGIIASSFGANHMMANLYYNIHRFVYSLRPALLKSSIFQSVNEGLGIIIPAFDASIKSA